MLNETDKKVLQALENKQYKWRTISGISSETQLPKSDIFTSIEHLTNEDMIISATRTTSSGEVLYTTKDRYLKGKDYRWNRILSILSDEIK
jgi:predicted transcriptional regulator